MCGGRCVSEVWWRGVAEVEKGEVNVVRGRELNVVGGVYFQLVVFCVIVMSIEAC